jgi:hypothetical protein
MKLIVNVYCKQVVAVNDSIADIKRNCQIELVLQSGYVHADQLDAAALVYCFADLEEKARWLGCLSQQKMSPISNHILTYSGGAAI